MEQEIKDWLSNINSVMKHFEALKKAQTALATGTKYGYRYKSPDNSKSYDAKSLMNLYNGTYDASDSADVEFRCLILQVSNILKLYSAINAAGIQTSNGRTNTVSYQRYSFTGEGELSKRGKILSVNGLKLLELYTEARYVTGVSYPITYV